MIGHLLMIVRSLMIGIILAAILYSQHVFADEISGLDTTELAHDIIGLVVIEGATR
jgi:hypothetical protein